MQEIDMSKKKDKKKHSKEICQGPATEEAKKKVASCQDKTAASGTSVL
jgi:hypothetical protein